MRPHTPEDASGGVSGSPVNETANGDPEPTSYLSNLRASFGDAVYILTYLGNPSRYLLAVDEQLVEERDELRRNVTVTLRTPTANTSMGAAVLTFIALKPRKGALVTIGCSPSNADGTEITRLNHREHRRLEQWLITTRIVSFLRAASIPEHRKQDVIARAPKLVHELREIPLLGTDAARARIKDIFGETDGTLIRLLRGDQSGFRNSHTADVINVDIDQLTRLRRLCQELATRYYVAYRVTTSKPSDDVHLAYYYLQHFEERTVTRRGRARSNRGAAPPAFRIHAPLARMTTHYSVRMDAPSGYYVARQNILEDVEFGATERPSDATRIYDTRLIPSTQASNISFPISREIGSGSYAHMFLDYGPESRRRLYVGIELIERPPGTTGRAYAIIRLNLLASTLLFCWTYVYAGGSETASLLAGLLGLGSYVVDAATPDVPLVNAPILPRAYLRLQGVLAMAFAVWLLGRGSGPPRPGSGWRWGVLSHVWRFWHAAGGSLILLALLIITFHLRGRVRRLRKLYNRTVRNRHASARNDVNKVTDNVG